MGTIETEKSFDKKLTTNIASGKFSYEELIDWVNNYYSGTVTEFIIWDFTDADLSKITTEEIKKIVQVVKKYSHKRAGGKTAFVSIKDLTFGLGRMFEILSEIEGIQFEYKNFKSVIAAKEWFGV